MLVALLCLQALTASASATVFSSGSDFTVKKELKGPGVAQKPLDAFSSELDMDFRSFDGKDTTGDPLVTSHTEQILRVRKLPKLDPKDPAAPKDGFLDRTEVTFEKLTGSNRVRVPGLNRTLDMRSDAGAILRSRPLVIRGDGKTPRKADDLDKIRAESLAEASDPGTRATISSLLEESTVLRMGSASSGEGTCLAQFDKKAIGDKWQFSREEQGAKLDFQCLFEGWAESGGHKIAVIKLKSDRQRNARTGPNGMPAMAETASDGVVYFDPASQEALTRQRTDITVLPPDADVERLKAQGKPVPTNTSVMKSVTHVYGI